KLTLLAIGVLVTLTVLSVTAPFITGTILGIDENLTDPYNAFLAPGEQGHILGTDDLGRDQLARLLHAGRVSLGIAFTAAVLSLLIGVALGVITGFYG